MKRITGTRARLLLLTVGLLGVFVALNAIPGGATPASGQTSVTLARGTDQSEGTIPFKQGTDVVVSQITFAPSGTSGWHSHPGGAIGVVKQGEVTIYQSVGNHCDTTTYTAGQSFIERPDVVVKAVNTGTTPTIVFVTFPAVPVGASARTDESDPGTC